MNSWLITYRNTIFVFILFDLNLNSQFYFAYQYILHELIIFIHLRNVFINLKIQGFYNTEMWWKKKPKNHIVWKYIIQ